jgi:hypothetical protein
MNSLTVRPTENKINFITPDISFTPKVILLIQWTRENGKLVSYWAESCELLCPLKHQ